MNMNKSFFDIHSQFNIGVNSIERLNKKQIYGENKIDIEMKSFLQLFFDEILSPFYFFQLISCAIWYYDNYWIYASTIIFISLISAILTVHQTRKNLINLRNMAEIKPVEVKSIYYDEVLSTEQLVPGDVIRIPKDFHLPCDLILLSGQCVVDESMLTGESVPVVKIGLPKEKNQKYSTEGSKQFTLYSGSVILTSKSNSIGLVVRTGFQTEKGQLLLSIIYPKPNQFKFYTDSLKFIAFMFVLGIAGMIYSTVTLYRLGSAALVILKKVLDVITISVPPALPIAMSSGTSFAMIRLKDKKIFCISPPRVNVAGMLNLICFDKTGTLTEDGLDLIEVVPFSDNILKSPRFNQRERKMENDDLIITTLMGTCHNISDIEGRFVGDPLEIKMFEATKWIHHEDDHGATTITNPSHENDVYHILKRFEFSSEFQRMSTLVKNEKNLFIFTKGSPEKIKEHCLKDSIPSDYDSSLIEYARKGYRVLSCARKIEPLLKEENLLSSSRSEIESDLEFVGFLIFQNKLKPQSKPTIKHLNHADIKSVMITGDNIYTAACVSRECELVDLDLPLYLGEWDEKNESILWKNVDNDRDVLDSSSIFEFNFLKKIELGITGKAFEKIYEKHTPLHLNSPLYQLICNCKIFARMLPDQKMKLVEAYQEIEYFTGMCGDGANDIGALKAAHVGVSLSEAEASIAAPFTSSIQNISSVTVVIQEGRCSLLTSFQMFKFMAMFSMIQFTAVCMLYNIRAVLADMHFLYVDLFLILPISLLSMNFFFFKPLSGKHSSREEINKREAISEFIFNDYHHFCTLIFLMKIDSWSNFNFIWNSIVGLV
jgi:cation-transporting P-type ATPase 13A2